MLNPCGVCGDGSLIRSVLCCFISAVALSIARSRILLEELDGLLLWDGLMTLWTVHFQLNYESTQSFLFFFFFFQTQSVIAFTEQQIIEKKRLLRKHSCSFSLSCWLAVICGDATHACLISVLWPRFTLVLFSLYSSHLQSVLTLLSILFCQWMLLSDMHMHARRGGGGRVEDSSTERPRLVGRRL